MHFNVNFNVSFTISWSSLVVHSVGQIKDLLFHTYTQCDPSIARRHTIKVLELQLDLKLHM